MLPRPYSAKRLVTKKSPAISLISQAATGRVGLFNFNFSASFFQRFFQCFCVVFAHAFFQRSWSRFYQVFSFFQTQTGSATNSFDYCNFVRASSTVVFVAIASASLQPAPATIKRFIGLLLRMISMYSDSLTFSCLLPPMP